MKAERRELTAQVHELGRLDARRRELELGPALLRLDRRDAKVLLQR